MNLSGFEKAKEAADQVQATTEGEVISNLLGAKVVNAPISEDDHIKQFNNGVNTMLKYGNNNIIA